MRTALFIALLLLAPLSVHAAPAENHWNAEIDANGAASLAEAARMIDSEDFASALPILQRLALDFPAEADVFNLLGFAHRNLDDLAASGRAYGRALFLMPTHLGALEYQGELFLTLGDVVAAEANLAKLETLCPATCEERDELAEAIAAWRAARPN